MVVDVYSWSTFPMKSYRLYAVVALFLLVCEFASSSTTLHNDGSNTSNHRKPFHHELEDDETTARILELMEWIVTNDGYVSGAQDVLKIKDDNLLDPYGVFANTDIVEDELLLSIPLDLVFSGESDCDMMMEFWTEYDMGENSDFEIYINFMHEHYDKIAVTDWSNHGKHLLFEILGGDLPPEDVKFIVQHPNLDKECNFGGEYDGYPFQNFPLVIGDEFGLIPLVDLYKHRNGKWHNVNPPFECDDGLCITASRPIKAGEQLHISSHVHDKEDYTSSELFARYGVIEQMPQNWDIGGNLLFQLDEVEKEFGDDDFMTPREEYQLKWVTEPSFYDKLFLENQMNRLRSIIPLKEKGISDFFQSRGISDLPSEIVYEWDAAWKYHKTLLFAIEKAVEAANQSLSTALRRSAITDKVSIIPSEEQDVDFLIADICGQTKYNYHVKEDIFIDEVQSPYQNLRVVKQGHDLCFALNNMIHTCSSYRPPMHEIYVHFPAAYLKSLKRVAFIGGGDSMVLHEVLKYPSVSYILGVELDQNVVRQNFKHFYTEPHFDNPRVHWIFGDATKTLQMLPHDYYGSFDLVVVDLPEDVMNLPVGDKLNLMEATSLLLNEEGIFIINDSLMPQLSDLWDHTLELRFDHYPTVCYQYFILGSDAHNFQVPNFQLMADFEVKNLFYSPLDNIDHHNAPISRYSKNDNGFKKHRHLANNQESDYKSKKINDGILTILDIENSLASKLRLEEIIYQLREVLKDIGFTAVNLFSDRSNDDINTLTAVLREGYIVIRTLPRYSYMAIDFHLWDKLYLEELAKKALTKAFAGQDGPVSSFSVVVGGLGLENKNLTPKPDNIAMDSKTKKCVNSSVRQNLNIIDKTNILIEEGIKFTSTNETGLVVVFCGQRNHDSCVYLDKFKDDLRGSVIAIYPSTSEDEKESFENSYPDSKGIKRIALSNQTLETTIKSLVSELKKKIQFLFIDAYSPSHMVYDFEKILAQEIKQKDYLDSDFVLMVPTDRKIDEDRYKLLDRGRKKLPRQHVSLSEIVMESMDQEQQHQLYVIETGRNISYPNFHDFITNVGNRAECKVRIEDWKAGLADLSTVIDFDTYNYTVDDYDNTKAVSHYNMQNQLATQQLVKITLKAPKCKTSVNCSGDMTVGKLVSALEHASILFSPTQSLNVEVIEGNALIAVLFMSNGQVITTWDGKSNIDMHVFIKGTYDHDLFAEYMRKQLNGKSAQVYGLHPRGTGRVVTFS